MDGPPDIVVLPADDLDILPAEKPQNRDEWLRGRYLNGTLNMKVECYLKTTSATHPTDSWWGDTLMDWVPDILRNRYAEHKDVFIVTVVQASVLYAIATVSDYVPDRTSQHFKELFAPVKAELESRDIIVIPVCNGSDSTAQQFDRQTQSQNGDPGRGSHWSLIVIDRRNKSNPTARYIDGMVTAHQSRKDKTKWKVGGLRLNGIIAGKILCGFDNLLRLRKGAFYAQSLKFVPHMSRGDSRPYPGVDLGRCGPHLYAIVDHILANKERLIDPGLEATFNDVKATDLLKTRTDELKFNSKTTRARFVNDLRQVRRHQENL
jgi:hypothetical protein